MLVKTVYIDCKGLKSLGVNVMHSCVVRFRVYVSPESLCLVHLGFSFLVNWFNL